MTFLPGDDVPFPEDAVEVGRIVGAWGIKGGFRVAPFAADPQALFSSRRWFIQPPENARPSAAAVPAPAAARTSAARSPASAAGGAKPAAPVALPRLLKITLARDQGDSIVATAQEVPDRTAAELLKGARIFVSRESFPTPDEDEFYWIDLIGMNVVNRDQQALGTVVGLIETGPHCVLRIQPADAKADEVLVPFVDAYVDKVETAAKLITVDWGLDF